MQNESPTTSNQQSATREHRGPVLDMLRELLAEGRTDDVLAVVRQLVTRNAVATGPFHRRDFHPLEVQLASLHRKTRLSAGA